MDKEIEKLIDNLWGRALDVTSSEDFDTDEKYLTAQANYKKHCLKELTQLINKQVIAGRISELKDLLCPIECHYGDNCKIQHTRLRKIFIKDRIKELQKELGENNE